MKFGKIEKEKMMKYALTNAVIYTGEEILKQQAVVIENDRILAIQPQTSLPDNLKQIDLNGTNLCAGFIDLQINGCGGVMFNDDISLRTLEIMQQTNLRSGTTSFLPTFITAPDGKMMQAVKVVSDYMHQHQNQILGIHLEGPYISSAKKGTHRAEFVSEMTNEAKQELLANADIIKMLTIAAENPTSQYIPEFVKAGIVVSIGHSNATFEQTQAAFHAGASCVTHLHNGMSPISSGREMGVVGAALYSDVYAGIIVDGKHVRFENIALDKKLKGERLFIITDAVAPAGSNIESFIFEGKLIKVKDKQCFDANGSLAGAMITMIESIANLVNHLDLPLDEALRMATLYPARVINVDDKLGSIHVGKIANLTVFDHSFNVKAVVVNGKYEAF